MSVKINGDLLSKNIPLNREKTVPALSDATVQAFAKISSNIPGTKKPLQNVRSLHKIAQDFNRIYSRAENPEKRHKILSVLSLALQVSLVTGVIVAGLLGGFEAAVIVGMVAFMCLMFTGILSQEIAWKIQENDFESPQRVHDKAGGLQGLFAGPAMYVNAAWGRKKRLQKKMTPLKQEAETNHSLLKKYVNKNYKIIKETVESQAQAEKLDYEKRIKDCEELQSIPDLQKGDMQLKLQKTLSIEKAQLTANHTRKIQGLEKILKELENAYVFYT